MNWKVAAVGGFLALAIPSFAHARGCPAHQDEAGRLSKALAILPEGAQVSYAGTPVPGEVVELLAHANRVGVLRYNPYLLRIRQDDEHLVGRFTRWPYAFSTPVELWKNPVLPAEGAMAFERTELNPDRLADEMSHEVSRIYFTPHSSGVSFEEGVGKESGTNAHHFDEHFWGLTDSAKRTLTDSRSGSRYGTNFAILGDGSVHLLPASRRVPDHPDRALTTTSLSRGKPVLVSGFLHMREGKITRVEISAPLSERLPGEYAINPRAVLEAWGFTLADDFEVVSGGHHKIVEKGPLITAK